MSFDKLRHFPNPRGRSAFPNKIRNILHLECNTENSVLKKQLNTLHCSHNKNKALKVIAQCFTYTTNIFIGCVRNYLSHISTFINMGAIVNVNSTDMPLR